MMLGEIAVLLTLTGAGGAAARSVWKSHKSGGHCGGDCSHCSGCHHK